MSEHDMIYLFNSKNGCYFLLKKCIVIAAFAGVILLPKTSYSGVCAGLKLWAQVVLPALFPALVITSCILSLFKIRKSFSYIYIIITGLLCGFPVGASLCSEFHISEPEEKVCMPLSAFCNISSPSFVINYIIYANMKNQVSFLKILCCIYLPVIECIVALLVIFRKEIFYSEKSVTVSKNDKHQDKSQNMPQNKPYESQLFFDILDNAIWKSIKSVLKLGGYIVVFSCIASYIALIPLPELYKSIICGITEITNGIYMCANLTISSNLKLFIITALNAFGGISTLMQTAGITDVHFFAPKKYTYNKCLLTIVTMVNTALITCIF